jgi:hypothetical protein
MHRRLSIFIMTPIQKLTPEDVWFGTARHGEIDREDKEDLCIGIFIGYGWP